MKNLNIIEFRISALNPKPSQLVTFVKNKVSTARMFRKLKELYQEYKEYVRVDLIMYAVMILLIILYFIYTVAF